MCDYRKEDTGVFECIAENEAGRASIRMDAVVYGMYAWQDHYLFKIYLN